MMEVYRRLCALACFAYFLMVVNATNEACEVCDCTTRGLVNCMRRGLTELPRGIPNDTIVLHLGDNFLQDLNSHGSLLQLKSLFMLNVTMNNISTPFKMPESVRTLFAAWNLLQDIKPILRNGVNLQSVSFFGNDLHTIETDTFKRCTQLLSLELRQNRISEIQPRGLAGPNNLAKLCLEENNIQELGPSTFEGFNCGKLRVDTNGLKILQPHTFGKLTKLGMLFLKDNQLEELPRGLFLDPMNVNAWTEFSRIRLDNNWIRRISPGAFLGVDPIVAISLSHNRLVTLEEDTFTNTTITAALDLSFNQLEFIPEGLLRGQDKLERLYLGRNQIRVLTRGMFQDLHSLTELMIFDNPIMEVTDWVFYDTGLTNLYMFQSELTSIGQRAFATMNKTLKEVSLYGNRLEIIPNEVWGDLGTSCHVVVDNILKFAPYTHRSDLHIELARDSFDWSFSITWDIAKMFNHSGFHCRHKDRQGDMWQCSPCPQGSFGATWSSICIPCPPGGFYQSKTGQLAYEGQDINCQKCNKGTYVTPESYPGKRPADCTVCPKGTNKSRYAGYRACPCLDNYYRNDRFDECYPCPTDGINCSGEYQHLLPGYWWTWDWGSDEGLYQSYVSFLEDLGEESPKYMSKNFSKVLPKVHACPRKDSCQNTADGVNATCETGYEGWLCSKCQTGFYSWFGACFACPKWWWFVLEVMAIAFVFVVIVLVIAWDLRRHRRSGRSIVSVLLARGKILLGFYQVMGEIFSALDEIPWPDMLKNVGSFLNFLQMNIMQLIISPRCYFPNFTYPNIYIEFLVGIAFVILVMLSAVCFYYSTKFYLTLKRTPAADRDMTLIKVKQKCFLCVVMLLFVSYPGLSGTIFTLLPSGCDLFDLDEEEKLNVSRLRFDYSIDCSAEPQVYYNYAAEAALCYVVGFPSVLFLILRSQRKKSRPLRRAHTAQSQENIPLTDVEYTVQPTSPEQGKSRVKELIDWQSFLCENYKSEFWYWEIVELARKVLQTLFVLLFGADDPFNLFLSIVISVGFLLVHAYVKPMKDAAEHRLQMCSLATIFLNLLVASLLLLPSGDGEPGKRMEVLAVFLVLLNLSLVVFVAISFAWKSVKAAWRHGGIGCLTKTLSVSNQQETRRCSVELPFTEVPYEEMLTQHHGRDC